MIQSKVLEVDIFGCIAATVVGDLTMVAVKCLLLGTSHPRYEEMMDLRGLSWDAKLK